MPGQNSDKFLSEEGSMDPAVKPVQTGRESRRTVECQTAVDGSAALRHADLAEDLAKMLRGAVFRSYTEHPYAGKAHSCAGLSRAYLASNLIIIFVEVCFENLSCL